MASVELKQLTAFLNDYLKINDIDDCSINGLQVQGKNQISKIAFMVDFSLQGAELAHKAGADMIIAHHGLIWTGLRSITGNTYLRVKTLIKNDISLYAAHLPLDMHPESGNNIGLAKKLGLIDIGAFAKFNGCDIGFYGTLPKESTLTEISKKIESLLKTKTLVLDFGKEKVNTIGLVSGAGVDSLGEAVKLGLDVLVTGEPRQTSYHVARENSINVIFAGHYATETVGVSLLAELLKDKFGVETEFIDLPTGI